MLLFAKVPVRAMLTAKIKLHSYCQSLENNGHKSWGGVILTPPTGVLGLIVYGAFSIDNNRVTQSKFLWRILASWLASVETVI